MGLKLKITGVTGLLSEETLQQWEGVLIPMPTLEFYNLMGAFSSPPHAADICEGYWVLTSDLVAAIEKAGKKELAEYWRREGKERGYKIPKNCSTLEGENPPGFSKEELGQYMAAEYGYVGMITQGAVNVLLTKKGFNAIFHEGKYFLEPWG